MPSLTTDKYCIPLSKLAYGTQQRLIDLAPLPELINFQLAGRQAYKIGSRREKPLYFDTLFITDVPKWAKRRIWLHKFTSTLNAPLESLSYYLDGPYNSFPYWYNCISCKQVLSQMRPIYVKKTLLLDFQSPEEYDKAVPLIHGTYQRLVLIGFFKWTHVKQLMHSGVKQVQLTGGFEIKSSEYAETEEFFLDRAKDPEFNLVANSLGNRLKRILIPAFVDHPPHSVKLHQRIMLFERVDYFCYYHVAYDWRFPLNLLRLPLWIIVFVLYNCSFLTILILFWKNSYFIMLLLMYTLMNILFQAIAMQFIEFPDIRPDWHRESI